MYVCMQQDTGSDSSHFGNEKFFAAMHEEVCEGLLLCKDCGNEKFFEEGVYRCEQCEWGHPVAEEQVSNENEAASSTDSHPDFVDLSQPAPSTDSVLADIDDVLADIEAEVKDVADGLCEAECAAAIESR